MWREMTEKHSIMSAIGCGEAEMKYVANSYKRG
jgi:hypothetical protein